MKMVLRIVICVCVIFVKFTALAGDAVSNPGCRIKIKGDTGGSECRIVMENEFVKIKIAPACGGRIVGFLHKSSGKEMVHIVESSLTPQGNGLLLDRFSAGKKLAAEFLEQLPSRYEVLDDRKERVAIRLWRKCRKDESRGIVIQKIIELKQRRSSVYVIYKVFNTGNDVKIGKLWIANVLSPGGPKARKRNIAFPFGKYSQAPFSSSRRGEETRSILTYHSNNQKAINHWVYDPAQAWVATYDPAGFGVGVEIEFSRLDWLYSWFPSVSCGQGFPTMEWCYIPIELRPINLTPNQPPQFDPSVIGNMLIQTIKFIPFAHLTRFDGCQGGIIGAIESDESNVNIRMYSDEERNVTILVGVRPVTQQNNVKIFAKKTLFLKCDETAAISLKSPDSISGNVVVVKIKGEDGSTIAEFERPIGKKAITNYHFQPKQKRVARALSARPDWHPQPSPPLPHTNWAKPYQKGAIKALCIVPFRSLAECIDMSKRIDIDIDYILVTYPHVFSVPMEVAQVADPHVALPILLKRPYDVILLCSGFYWDRLPAKLQHVLAKKIKQGTGLVYVRGRGMANNLDKLLKPTAHPEDIFYLTAGIPWKSIPGTNEALSPKKQISLYQLGNGRVAICRWNVWLGYRPWMAQCLVPVPLKEEKLPEYRYYEYPFALLAKLLYWAAKKEPTVRLTALKIKPPSGQQTDQSLGKLFLTLKGYTSNQLHVEVNIYNSYHKHLLSFKKPILLENKDTNIELDLPAVSEGGVHLIEFRLLDGEKSIDWGAAMVKVNSPVSFANTAFNKEVYNVGEPVVIRISLRNRSINPQNVTIKATLTDVEGRIIRQINKPFLLASTKGNYIKKTQISFRKFIPVNPYHRIALRLISNGKQRDYRMLRCSIRLPLPTDYNFICWADYICGGNYTDEQHVKLVRTLGFDIYSMFVSRHLYTYSLEPLRRAFRYVTDAGLRPFAQAVSPIVIPRSKNPTIRPEPLSAPRYRKEVARRINSVCEAGRKYNLIALSPSDEPSLGWYGQKNDFCQHPTTLAKFRPYLKKMYGNLKRLNISWKRNFKSWDKVVPDTYDEAKERNHWASWVDHRLFMEQEMADFLKFVRETIRHNIEGVYMALSGMGYGNEFNGLDFSRIMPLLNYASLYGDGDGEFAKIEVERSFKNPDALLGVWIGYGRGESELRAWMWLEAIHDMFLLSFYSTTYMVEGQRAITSYGRMIQNLIKEYRESGTGALLRYAERLEDPVAILYSRQDVMAAAVPEQDITINGLVFRKNLDGWSKVLEDAGFNGRFISTEQLNSGILKQKAYKALILPLAQSLSLREINILKQFVQNGGTLIADVRTGIFNEHCVPFKVSPLDSLFGIDRSRCTAVSSSNVIKVCKNMLGITERQFHSKLVEKGFEFKGGVAVGQGIVRLKTKELVHSSIRINVKREILHDIGPAIIINRVGKGYAVYLNFLMYDYREKRGNNTAPIVSALIRECLGLNGIKPEVSVLRNREPLPGTEIVRYDFDGVSMVALQRDSFLYHYPKLEKDKPEKVFIKLPVGGNVYEVWTRRFMGTGKEIQDTLEPGARRLYVILPYKINKIKINAFNSVARGETLRLEVSIPGIKNPVNHIFRISVINPYGQDVQCLSRNIRAPHGKTTVTLPIALNDPTGYWKIRVRDILTGVSNEIKFNVTP